MRIKQKYLLGLALNVRGRKKREGKESKRVDYVTIYCIARFLQVSHVSSGQDLDRYSVFFDAFLSLLLNNQASLDILSERCLSTHRQTASVVSGPGPARLC